MNIDDLRAILMKEKIKQQACLINPRPLVEGALCVNKQADGSWVITLNERGEYLIHQSFQSESEACRFFLKHVLSDPTYRNDFQQSDLLYWENWEKEKKHLLGKYDLK